MALNLLIKRLTPLIVEIVTNKNKNGLKLERDQALNELLATGSKCSFISTHNNH
jgi:hypothetical protein